MKYCVIVVKKKYLQMDLFFIYVSSLLLNYWSRQYISKKSAKIGDSIKDINVVILASSFKYLLKNKRNSDLSLSDC